MMVSNTHSPQLTGCSGHYQLVAVSADGLSSCYVAGTVFRAGKLMCLTELAAALWQAIHDDQLVTFLQSLDGFFSILIRDEHHWWLIADRLRSRPLFYRPVADGWLVCDSAWQLLQAGDSLDPLASEEFLHCGYVTGSATLIDTIEQTQAGRFICLPHKTRVAISTRYALFWPLNSVTEQLSADDYAAKLDRALVAATERLISVAAGRTILLPLSGGYDSRALAVYLKKLAYPYVQCFTFGKESSFEVKRARQVASALGFHLHQLVYRPADWSQLQDCPDFRRFLCQIHNLVSVPNVQVYLAIKRLRDSGCLPADVLVVPGHTGDFVSGGHIPQLSTKASIEQLVASIWRRHYDHSRQPASSALLHKLHQQLLELGSAGHSGTPAASHAEAWNYQERQAKFIVNSNRYYDFWQLDWWMPLWDWQFVTEWQKVPLALRLGKQLWIKLVDQQYQTVSGQRPPADDNNSIARFQSFARRYFNYFLDPNYLLHLVPFHWWLKARLKLNDSAPSVFAYLASVMLARVEEQLKQINEKNREKKNCI